MLLGYVPSRAADLQRTCRRGPISMGTRCCPLALDWASCIATLQDQLTRQMIRRTLHLASSRSVLGPGKPSLPLARPGVLMSPGRAAEVGLGQLRPLVSLPFYFVMPGYNDRLPVQQCRELISTWQVDFFGGQCCSIENDDPVYPKCRPVFQSDYRCSLDQCINNIEILFGRIDKVASI